MFISVTRLRLRGWRFLVPFLFYTNVSAIQAWLSSGNCRVRLRKTRRLAFWTLTFWKNKEAMLSFRNSGLHARAMTKLKDWCDEAAYAHWEGTESPSWETATQNLINLGRLSPVKYPSVEQHEGKISIGKTIISDKLETMLHYKFQKTTL